MILGIIFVRFQNLAGLLQFFDRTMSIRGNIPHLQYLELAFLAAASNAAEIASDDDERCQKRHPDHSSLTDEPRWGDCGRSRCPSGPSVRNGWTSTDGGHAPRFEHGSQRVPQVGVRH